MPPCRRTGAADITFTVTLLAASAPTGRVRVIEGYHARLSRHKLGYGVTGFVHLQMSNHLPEVMAAFEREVVALPDALVCHNLSGHYDYLIEAIAVDLESFS